MRSIFHWLSLLALLLAPLSAPAAASAPLRPSAECHIKAMAGARHVAPAARHHSGESCCVAVPQAIDPPLTALEAVMPVGRAPLVASTVSFRLGAGPPFEDPPPRLD